MADTVRTLTALQALLPDNTDGDISAQDVRDFLVSAFGPYRVLLSETEITSSVTDETITDIDQSYLDLLIVAEDVVTADAAEQDHLHIQLGDAAIDTGTTYHYYYRYSGTTSGSGNSNQADSFADGTDTPNVIGAGDTSGSSYAEWLIRDYAASRSNVIIHYGAKMGDTFYHSQAWGMWENTDPVTRVKLFANGGNLTSGTVKLYGLGVAGQ